MLGNAAAAGAGLGAPGGENKAGPGGQLPELPGLPGLFPGLTGGLFQRAQQSDLQRAMDVYHQELQRLQQNALAALRAQQNGKDENAENRPKTETPGPPESPSADTKSPGAARQESPLGNYKILLQSWSSLSPVLVQLWSSLGSWSSLDPVFVYSWSILGPFLVQSWSSLSPVLL